jgi:exodeoxyribonuclease VIII
MEDYHADDALSKTGIVAAAIAPAVYYQAKVLGQGKKDSQSMKMGRLFHAIMDGSFPQIAVKGPAVKSRAEAAWKAFERENEGKVCLKPEEWDSLQRMASATRSFPPARDVLERGGRYEVSFYWLDDLTDLECKCRPDFITDDYSTVVDFKTTVDPGHWAFREAAYRYHYYVSAAHTLAGVKACTGVEPERYLFVAQQSESPWLTAVYQATADEIKLGQDLIKRTLQTIKECKTTNVWPGLPIEVMPLGLPYRGYQELRKLDAEEKSLRALVA